MKFIALKCLKSYFFSSQKYNLIYILKFEYILKKNSENVTIFLEIILCNNIIRQFPKTWVKHFLLNLRAHQINGRVMFWTGLSLIDNELEVGFERSLFIKHLHMHWCPSLCPLGLTPITHKNGAEAHLSQAPQLCHQIESAPDC